jgi:hypothetical protein
MQHEEPSRNKSKAMPNKPNDSIPNPDSPQTTLIPSSPYSTDENNAIDQLFAIAAAFDKSKNTKKMITASPLAQGKKLIATKGQNMTTGYYSTKVPIGLLDLHNFIFPSTREETGNYIDRSVEEINDHHSIRYLAKAFLKPVSDREWHRSVITKVET